MNRRRLDGLSHRLRLVLLLTAAAGTSLFLWRVRFLLVPFFLAAVLAYLLNPLVRILERREVPRNGAILLIYAAGIVLATIVGLALVPVLAAELGAIVDALPEQRERLESFTLDMVSDLRRLPFPDFVDQIVDTAVARVEQQLGQVANRILESLPGAFTALFYVILSPVLAYFILRDWSSLQRRIIEWFPPSWQEDILLLAKQMNGVLAGFIRGQLMISLIIGLIIAAGLSLLGVRYALVVGLIAGAFDIIPYFGPVVGSVPAVMLAIMSSPTTAIWAILLLVAVNQLEGVLLAPKVVGEYVGLHPVTVIFAVLAGAELLGILGMLLAVPVAAIIKVLAHFAADRMSTTPVR